MTQETQPPIPKNDSICRDCGQLMSTEEGRTWGQCGFCHIVLMHRQNGFVELGSDEVYIIDDYADEQRSRRAEASEIQYHGGRFNQGEW